MVDCDAPAGSYWSASYFLSPFIPVAYTQTQFYPSLKKFKYKKCDKFLCVVSSSVGNFSGVTNTTPTVMYKRRRLTRYVLVVEDTAAMQVRESWGFLRTAVRKWLVYDLPLNTEVGVVLCNESSASSLHRISTLESQSGRDFLAAMFPYAPGDSRAAGCLHCGVREALNVSKLDR